MQADEEIASGTQDPLDPPFPRTGPRSARSRPHTPLPRRSSASNMQEQSFSKGLNGTSGHIRRSAREPAPVNRWSPTDDAAEVQGGCRGEDVDRFGDEGPTASLHSQEGDTEAANAVHLQLLGLNHFKLCKRLLCLCESQHPTDAACTQAYSSQLLVHRHVTAHIVPACSHKTHNSCTKCNAHVLKESWRLTGKVGADCG